MVAFENYECDGQMDIFDWLGNPREEYKITKPIRLIELFAGIGAQAKALENLGVQFEHWKVVEFDKYAVMSYNAVHGTDFKPSDIRNVKAKDLEIVNTDQFTYLLTYLLISLSRFVSCWKTTWNVEGNKYQVGFTLGSRKNFARVRRTS